MEKTNYSLTGLSQEDHAEVSRITSSTRGRFFLVFNELMDEEYLYLMGYLFYQKERGNVIKGIKETIKAIEFKKAKFVYIAEDCELKDYIDLIVQLCEFNNVQYYKVKSWRHLRDILIDGLTSLEIENIARIKNKDPKITPKCNCAVILLNEEDDAKKNIFFEFDYKK